MKKILIVCGKLCVGGAEKVAFSIGHFRDNTKYECHYLVFGDEIGAYENNLIQDNCTIIHMPPPSDSYIKFVHGLNNLMQRNKYDVVHCHTMFNSGIVLSVAKYNKVPCRIAHSHSIYSGNKRNMKKYLYETTMRMLILMVSTHYVACGKKAGEWLFGEKTFQKKGILILNGIDTKVFQYSAKKREEKRKEMGLENNFIIGHAGHLANVKNQSFLINMMPQILKEKPEAVLLLLGDGVDRQMLEKLAKDLNVADKVVFTGNVLDVPNYLSAMDVFAFPSLYEGMPLALMEVQSNGLPCVISDAIPKDVILTDLITVLPLTNTEEAWISNLFMAKRKDSENYSQHMMATGYDTVTMLQKIYNIYDQ